MGRFYLIIFLSFIAADALATHLRAGEIIATRVNCTSRTFRITVTVYIDTQSGVHFGGPGEYLNFGDESFIEIPDTPTTPRPDLGPEMGMAQFVTEHTYGTGGSFLIRYAEPYRNGGVLNLDNPLETMFYIETKINLELGCDNSPRLRVPPIDKGCVGSAWTHNPGAYDIDPGDSLSYELVVPKMGFNKDVVNYRDPNLAEFYRGRDYETANEAGTARPDFKIDPVSGTITWDAPGMQGEYNIAFIIKEWREIGGKWVMLGYVERDMQIIIEDCLNQRPELQVPADICVEAGTLIDQDIFGFDPDSDSVMFNVYSTVFELTPRATIDPPQPVFMKSSPANPARLGFSWQTDCSHIKEQAYQVVFKITDKPRSGGTRLVQFKTWRITVVGPAPKWESANVNPANRSADIQWKQYQCSNATIMQVWRRVESFPFTPPECVTGMPAALGYTKIAEVNAAQVVYNDNNGGKGLAPGAQYCYRLVAVFDGQGGAQSYVSQEICLPPILATSPVITNVTVDRTSQQEGQITVKWLAPFDIDEEQFPRPYSYEVYRSEGLNGKIRQTKPHPGRLDDLTYSDVNLNTDGIPYNYQVIAYDANNVKIDSSFAASSVRLEAVPQLNKIELVWTANVPWSNKSEKFPTHMLYRGLDGTAEEDMELIANVDVSKGFYYIDEGLDNTKKYCYRVMTRGTYGNPKIIEPLLNYSQKLCATPNDSIPPCKPEFGSEIIAQACDEIQGSLCGINVYRNIIKWNRPADTVCNSDIVSYSIYVADQLSGDFRLYEDNVRDTFFVDPGRGLQSFARCYKIQAVDRSGNRSELSEQFCFDNCPYYELPNVFTPNNDTYNNLFSAFGDPDLSHPIGYVEDPSRCAKFVKHVEFTVFDRWGKTIWKLKDGKERSIYVRWDGRDNDGHEVPEGVYYYRADVYYYTVDPSKELQVQKGWVHLVRERE